MLCNGSRVHKPHSIMSIPVSIVLHCAVHEWIMRLRRLGEWNVVENGGICTIHSLRNIPSETFVLTRDVTLSWAAILIAGRKYSKTGIHKIYGGKTIRTFLTVMPIQIHAFYLRILLYCYECRASLPIAF